MAPGAFEAAEAQGQMLLHLSADQKEEKGQEAGWDLKSQCHPTSDQQPTSLVSLYLPKVPKVATASPPRKNDIQIFEFVGELCWCALTVSFVYRFSAEYLYIYVWFSTWSGIAGQSLAVPGLSLSTALEKVSLLCYHFIK